MAGNIVDLMGRAFEPPAQKQPDPPEVQLVDAIQDAGLTPPTSVVIDGRLHRFSSDGRPKDDSGWYIAFPGQVVAGSFGCWRLGLTVPFRADIGRDLTQAESMALAARMAEAKRLRDAEQAKRRESAADTAQAIWDAATTADDAHPYLREKGIANPGLRVTGDGRLVAPMYLDGHLSSLQFIGPDGSKKFLPGGKAGGATWRIAGADTTTYVCEGVATAASIYEATGCTVVIAYSAGNLTAAAQTATGRVVVVADNDPSGTGLREATRAAEAVGGRVVMPPAGDANDYARAGGDLSALLAPPQTGWLIPADDFAGQPAPIRWLVKRWIQRDALHMVHGPSGGGKTFAVLDMILSAAAGLSEWCGHRVTACPVVYLAGEGHHGLRARIAGWKQHRSAAHLKAWVSKAGDDLNTPGGLGRVQDAIRALPEAPAIIVVDTLHRFLNGDENSAQDAKTMLDACAALQAEFSAAVILVHHTGVSDEAQHRARGSSAWRGALDIEISVVPGTPEKPMELIQRKSKDAELAPAIFARLETVTLPWLDEDGEQVTTAVLAQDDAPVVVATESKALATARQLIEGAAISYGYRLSDGSYFVSAGYIREYALNHGSYPTDGARRQAVSEAKKRMLEAGKMTEHSDGYAITDPVIVSAISMLSQVKKRASVASVERQ